MEERAKAEAEAEAKRKEEERIAQEKAQQEERERKEKEEIERQAKIEAEQAYKDFLSKNGYTEETKDQFHIITIGDVKTLYKFVAVYDPNAQKVKVTKEQFMQNQMATCESQGAPMFMTEKCFSCHNDVALGWIEKGKDGTELVTGCPYCSKSFVD